MENKWLVIIVTLIHVINLCHCQNSVSGSDFAVNGNRWPSLSEWSTWSACSTPCGDGGQQRRTRIKCQTRWNCEKQNENRSCNNFCYNEGTLLPNGLCSCRFPYTGRCCKEVHQCPQPTAPRNGEVLGNNYNFGAMVTHRCDPNFEFVSRENVVRFCTGYDNIFGGIVNWNGSTPECVFKCPCLGKGTCDYTSAGVEPQFTCLCPDGKTGKLCESSLKCEEPPAIKNGLSVRNGLEHGSMVSYHCYSNHVLVGERTRFCRTYQGRLEWTGESPNCSFICPCAPGGKCDGDESSYTCKCNLGWKGTTCKEVNMVIYIGLISVTLVILLGFTVMSVLYCRNIGKNKKSVQDDFPPSYDSIPQPITIPPVGGPVSPPPYMAEAPPISTVGSGQDSPQTCDTTAIELSVTNSTSDTGGHI